jgi:parvulin-like peptidyl-prolyl isomerase
MMTKIREKTHIFLWILIICFIALIVIEWGANYSDIARTNRGIIGKVGGSDVRYADFQAAYYNQVQQTQQQRDGGELSESELESISDQIWNQVVEEMLLTEFIRQNEVTVGDSEIVYNLRVNPPDFLRQNPTFQTDGKFDATKYVQALNNPGLAKQWAQIESILRVQLPFSKVQSIISSTVQVTEGELRQEYIRRNLKVDGRFVFFSPAEFKVDEVEVTDDDLQKYYDEHRDEFKVKETARLAFVSFDDKATADDSTAFFERLNDVARQVREGKDFGELANAYSEDRAANQTGGSLGWFARGTMVKEFEDACFNGKPGEVIGPIQTQFGYHIIKIEDAKFFPGKTRASKAVDAKEPQDSVKASHILMRLSASQQTVETAREYANGFYETARDEGFEQALAKYGSRQTLKVDTTTQLTQNEQGMIAGFPDRLRNVLRFGFSEKVGATTRPHRTTFGFTVFHLVEHNAESVQSLEEVRDRVRNSVIEEKRKDLADQKARTVRSRIQSLNDLPSVDSTLIVRDLSKLTMTAGLPGVGRDLRLNSAAFQVPVGALSDVVKGNRGSYLVEVTAREEFDEQKYQQARQDLKRQLLSLKQQRAYRDWLESLKKRADVEDFRADFNL